MKRKKKAPFLPVIVSIESEITDLTVSSEFTHDAIIATKEDVDGFNRKVESFIENSEKEKLKLITAGRLTVNGNLIETSYCETEESGMGGSVTTLHIDTLDRGLVTMTRCGTIKSALTFNLKDRRQICVYDIPEMPMQFVVNTRRVENTIGENGGSLTLDYDLEMNGVRTERSLLKIDISPKKTETDSQ